MFSHKRQTRDSGNCDAVMVVLLDRVVQLQPALCHCLEPEIDSILSAI
jgi:hypothetical protein